MDPVGPLANGAGGAFVEHLKIIEDVSGILKDVAASVQEKGGKGATVLHAPLKKVLHQVAELLKQIEETQSPLSSAAPITQPPHPSPSVLPRPTPPTNRRLTERPRAGTFSPVGLEQLAAFEGESNTTSPVPAAGTTSPQPRPPGRPPVTPTPPPKKPPAAIAADEAGLAAGLAKPPEKQLPQVPARNKDPASIEGDEEDSSDDSDDDVKETPPSPSPSPSPQSLPSPPTSTEADAEKKPPPVPRNPKPAVRYSIRIAPIGGTTATPPTTTTTSPSTLHTRLHNLPPPPNPGTARPAAAPAPTSNEPVTRKPSPSILMPHTSASAAPQVAPGELNNEAVREARTVLASLVSGEKSYLDKLQYAVSNYMPPLREIRPPTGNNAQALKDAFDAVLAMFSNLELMTRLHTELHSLLAHTLEGFPFLKVSDVFQRVLPLMDIYTQYVINFATCHHAVSKLRESYKPFADALVAVETNDPHGGLELIIALPLNRIPQYELSLALLGQHAQGIGDTAIHTALARMKQLQESVNESLTHSRNTTQLLEISQRLTGLDRPLAEASRRFVREGSCMLGIAGGSALKDRYVFLFNDILLVTRAATSKLASLKAPMPTSYEVLQVIKIHGLKVRDGAGDVATMKNAIALTWVGGATATQATLVLSNAEEKAAWLRDLTAVVEEQLSLKGPPAPVATPHDQKKKLVHQLLESEKNYVHHLLCILQSYYNPMTQDAKLTASVMTKEDEAALFGNIRDLYRLNVGLVEQLEQVFAADDLPVGRVFAEFAPKLEAYAAYITGFPAASEAVERLKRKARYFGQFLKACEARDTSGLDFMSLLRTPVRRFSEYLTFLQQVMRVSAPEDPDRRAVDESLHKISEIAAALAVSNEGNKQLNKLAAVQGKLLDFTEDLSSWPSRMLFREGDLAVVALVDITSSGTVAATSNSGKGAGSERTHHFFLLTDMLIEAKKKLASDKYKFLRKFSLMSAELLDGVVLPTTDIPVPPSKFAFTISTQTKVLALATATAAEKEAWMHDFGEVIKTLSRTRVFGVPLARLMDRERGEIPAIVSLCTRFVAENALTTQGIFRLSGSQLEIAEVRDRFDRGEPVQFDPKTDPHVAAGVLKLWLRELPEPLMTFDLYDRFLGAVRPNPTTADPFAAMTSELKRLINSNLPQTNRYVLQELFGLLRLVAELADINNMHSRNLSIVFGPTLLKRRGANPFDCADYERIYAVVTTLLDHYSEIFGDVIRERAEEVRMRKSLLPAEARDERKGRGDVAGTPGSSGAGTAQVTRTRSDSSIEDLLSRGRNFTTAGVVAGDGGQVPPGTIIKEGLLMKKGGKRTNWLRRWFVLKNGWLGYFKASKDETPKGSILLINSDVAMSNRKQYCFSITTAERTFYLQAKSQQEMNEWMSAIQSCIIRQNA